MDPVVLDTSPTSEKGMNVRNETVQDETPSMQDEIDKILGLVGDALLDVQAESVAKDALNRLAAYIGRLEQENEGLRTVISKTGA